MATLGMIGLGRMGGNMAERLRRAGHEVVGYDQSPGKRDVDSLPALVEALAAHAARLRADGTLPPPRKTKAKKR